METFITICGFAGSWLLVAGPIYQAALELKDESFEREHLHELHATLPPPDHSSTWWWLLPPVKLALERSYSKRYRRQFFGALSNEDAEAMLAFMNKATGWLFVAGGGLLLALNETYDIVEHFQWASWLFWVIAVGVALLCFANTASRMSRSEQIIAKHHTR